MTQWAPQNLSVTHETEKEKEEQYNALDLHGNLLATIIRRNLIIYFYPVLILAGIGCNSLTLWVMTTRSMRKNPTSVCFAVLSIVDSALLLFSALLYWIWAALDINVWAQNDSSCKATVFLCFVSVGVSVWIICLITLERFTAVYFPFQVARVFTTRRSAGIILVIVLLLLLIHTPLIGELRVGDVPTVGSECKMEWDPGFYKIFSVFQSTMLFILPYLILLVLNVLIVRRTIKAGKHSVRLSSQVRRRISTNSAETLRLTLLKNLFFLCGYLPVCMFIISDGLFALQIQAVQSGDYSAYVRYRLVFQISCTMVFISHGCNFFLYLASGRKFRSVFLESCGLKRGTNRGTNWTPSASIHNSSHTQPRDFCLNILS